MDNGSRKNQQEKSQKMRMRLIEATLSCLQTFGFHGASLSRILEKAEASRGAWRHHYATKNDLVAAASEYLLSTALEKAKSVAETLVSEREPGETAEIADILEIIWDQFYQGRYRDVWVEFNVACRTDDELRERLAPVIRSFFEELDSIWASRLSTFSRSGLKAETVMNLSLYLLRGMSFQSLSMDNAEHYKAMRKAWADMLAAFLGRKTGAE
jgi:AcrR family transcriptional regulator